MAWACKEKKNGTLFLIKSVNVQLHTYVLN